MTEAAIAGGAETDVLATASPDGLDAIQWRRRDGALRTAHASPRLREAGLEQTLPIRSGVQYPNRPNQHGLYFWPRTGEHVWYESALELASLVELDYQREAAVVTAQPLRMLFRRGAAAVYHDPDFFAVHGNGDQVVYDVKPAHRVESGRVVYEPRRIVDTPTVMVPA